MNSLCSVDIDLPPKVTLSSNIMLSDIDKYISIIKWLNRECCTDNVLFSFYTIKGEKDDELAGTKSGPAIMLVERLDCNIITTSRLVQSRYGKELLIPLPFWTSGKVKLKHSLNWKCNGSNMYVFDNLKDVLDYIYHIRLVFEEFDYVKSARKNSRIRLNSLKDVSIEPTQKKKKTFVPKIFISG